MRAAEGIMAICLAGGVSPQAAAWFCDLAALYVSAIGYEEALWVQRENSTKSGEEPDHDADRRRHGGVLGTAAARRLPAAVAATSAEMTTGDGDERFEFGLDVLISGLAAVSERYR